MQFLKKHWVAIVAILYSVFILLYTLAFILLVDGQNQLLPSNELGDFLAGAFAPLAFFILIMGYIQQGRELREQAEELRRSVEQQQELVKVTREQYLAEKSARQYMAQPKLLPTLKNLIIGSSMNSGVRSDYYYLKIQIDNKGASITRARIDKIDINWTPDDGGQIGSIATDEVKIISLESEKQDIPITSYFEIVFVDAIGSLSKCKFRINYKPLYPRETIGKFSIEEI